MSDGISPVSGATTKFISAVDNSVNNVDNPTNSRIYNLIIDQNNDKYLYVTNKLEISGASFKDILGAKIVNDSGQNVHTCKVSDEVPGYQKHGINLIR